MKTAKQWYETVKEEEARKALLSRRINQPDTLHASLADAILWGFLWPPDIYWVDLYERAELNQIETL